LLVTQKAMDSSITVGTVGIDNQILNTTHCSFPSRTSRDFSTALEM